MATTNNFSLPYPHGNDPYNIPEDIANLAISIDSSLKAVSDSVATLDYSTTETVEEVQRNLEILEQEINRAGLPNVEQIMVDIEEARKELEAAKEEFSVGQAELGVHLTNLRDERMPALEKSVRDAQVEMDTAMEEFTTRQTQFEDSISTAEEDIAEAKRRLGQNDEEIAATKDRLNTAENVLEDKADTSRLNELDGKLTELGTHFTKVWRQPTPPPAGTHYEWEGEPHGSVTVRLDGVGNETARNLIHNPSFENNAAGWTTGGLVTIDVISGSSAVSGIRLLRAVGPQPTSPNVWVDEMRDLDPTENGQWTAASFWLRSRNDYIPASMVRFGFLANGSWSYHTGQLTEVESGRWTNVKFAAKIPDDATQIRTMVYFRDPASGPLPDDFEFWVDSVHRDNADTEEAALAQVSIYFDGDTASDRANDLWYDADGVPHVWVNGQGWTILTDQRLDNLSQILDDAQDDLQEALEGPIDHERLRVGTGAFDEAFASKLIADHATLISAAIRNLSVSEKLLFAEAIGEEVWAKLGVFDKLEAEEGWVGGTMLGDGVVVTKVLEATEQIITNMFATNYAQIEEELVVKGKLFAENATLINAAMQTLSVTEMANFVTAFADELYADEFTARSAVLARAIVAAPNLWPQPDFPLDSAWDKNTYWEVTGDGKLEARGQYSPEGGRLVHPEIIPVEQGATVEISVTGEIVPGISWLSATVIVQAVNAVGEVIETYNATTVENGESTGTVEITADAPDYAGIRVGFDTPANMTYSRRVYLSKPRVTNMNDGRLIVPGSIDASRLNAREIFANELVSNEIWANIVRAKLLEAEEALIGGALIKNDSITVGKLTALDEILAEMLRVRKIESGDIAADAITAGKIAGGAIDGKTITGSTVRTSASGSRVEMRNDALTAYNSSNSIQARYSGSGIELRQPGGDLVEIGPHIFGSAAFSQDTRTFSSSPGNSFTNWTFGSGSVGNYTPPARDIRVDMSMQPTLSNTTGANMYVSFQIAIEVGGYRYSPQTIWMKNWPPNTSFSTSRSYIMRIGPGLVGRSNQIRVAVRYRAMNFILEELSFVLTPA